MSDLKVPGFQASEIIESLGTAMGSLPEKEKQAQIKKTNGIFELQIKNSEGKVATWTIDMKNKGEVTAGPAKPKADVTLLMDDSTFAELASGKLNGQKAFMTGKLKTKGNIMLATKLDGVLKTASQAKAKL